jgi:hypothetical protein
MLKSMIPKSCRLFGKDHVTKQRDQERDRFRRQAIALSVRIKGRRGRPFLCPHVEREVARTLWRSAKKERAIPGIGRIADAFAVERIAIANALPRRQQVVLEDPDVVRRYPKRGISPGD